MTSVNPDDRKTVEHKIVSLVQKIDSIHSSATCVGAIFSPEAIAIRSKLQQYCLTVCLNIESSNESTRKAEESIWRKLFHNVVHSYKSLKSRQPAQVEIDSVRNHLIAGIGFYSNLIQLIASSSQLNLQILDHLQVYDENLFNLSHDEERSVDVKMDETRARQSILRSLIYLGDICRYLDDLKWPGSRSLAIYWYNNALLWDPTCGMPHNQLATLFSGVNHDIDSCYHYLRCITSEKPFDGAEANLKRLLSRCIFVPRHSMSRLRANIGQSSKKDDNNVVKKTVDLFLSIAYSLLHSSQQNTPFSDILDEFTHAYLVSTGTVDASKQGSHESKSSTAGTGGSKSEVVKQVSPAGASPQGHLANDITFKIAMMALMILMKCPSFAKPNALALVMNFYFTLIAHCEKKCKEIVQKVTVKSQSGGVNGCTGKLAREESSSDSPLRRRDNMRRRRRRRRGGGQEDSSDESYAESDESEALLEKIALRTIDALEITSDVSDEDVHDDLLTSDEEEEEEEEEEAGEDEADDEEDACHLQGSNSRRVIESEKSILCGRFYTESPLATLKVYCDWIAANRYLFDSLEKVDFQSSICVDLAKILDSVVSHDSPGELADGVRKDSCHTNEQQAPKYLSIDLALVKFPLLPQSHSFDVSRPCLSNSQSGYLCASSVLHFITNRTHSL